jgi:hypothetical protein
LSVQPGLRGSNDLRVGRKMATFQSIFQLGRAKDLSAPLYKDMPVCWELAVDTHVLKCNASKTSFITWLETFRGHTFPVICVWLSGFSMCVILS